MPQSSTASRHLWAPGVIHADCVGLSAHLLPICPLLLSIQSILPPTPSHIPEGNAHKYMYMCVCVCVCIHAICIHAICMCTCFVCVPGVCVCVHTATAPRNRQDIVMFGCIVNLSTTSCGRDASQTAEQCPFDLRKFRRPSRRVGCQVSGHSKVFV